MKKAVMVVFLALVLGLPVFAAPSVQLTWDAVTTYEDGVPIEAGKVVKYDVWRATTAALTGAVRLGFDLTATAYADLTVAPKNTYYYYVRAYLVDTLPSDNSNTASARVWPPFKTNITSIVVVK